MNAAILPAGHRRICGARPGESLATKLGNAVIPPPAGVDLSTVDGFKAAIPLYEAKQWLPVFFEHAVGSLAGASSPLTWPRAIE